MSKVVEKILEALQGQAENAVDLFKIMATDRSTSYRRARRSLRYGPQQFKVDWADQYRERQGLHSLLNKLKREGFIKQGEKRRNAPWRITSSGIKKLVRLQNGQRRDSSPLQGYEKKKSQKVIIIAFDVPERERRKRYWLRAALVALGFQKLQQSVWLGKVQIPQEFFTDLKNNGMLSYVHLFSITKGGTLKEEEAVAG